MEEETKLPIPIDDDHHVLFQDFDIGWLEYNHDDHSNASE